MHTRQIAISLCLAVAAASPAVALTPADVQVEYWAGSGANQAVFIIDIGTIWNYGFGYRWDGPAAPSALDALLAIDAAGALDVRTTFFPGLGQYVDSFSYRGLTNAVSGALGPMDSPGWCHYAIDTSNAWTSSWLGAQQTTLADGMVDGWSYGIWAPIDPNDPMGMWSHDRAPRAPQAGVPVGPAWTGASGSTWSTGFGAAPASGSIVNFGAIANTSATVLVDAAATPGALSFDSATTKYTLSGSAIALTGSAAAISAVAGTHQVSAELAVAVPTAVSAGSGATLILDNVTGSGGIVKAGLGTVNLAGTAVFGGTAEVTAGLLLVDGVLAGSGNLSVGWEGTLGGHGAIERPVSVSGKLAPGNSIGTLTTTAASLLSGSVLEIQASASAADKLIVGGPLSITEATMQVRVDLDTPVLAGTSFDVVAFASRSGEFEAVDIEAAFAGGSVAGVYFNVAADSDSYNLSLMAFMPGDADLDGQVKIGDLVALAQNWNSAGQGWRGGDFDGDGEVKIGDLVALAQNWNRSLLAAPPAAAVPEPLSVALLAAGGLALVRRRRM
jgi:hypothetical protein